MSDILLGWQRSAASHAYKGRVAYCDPSHKAALLELREELELDILGRAQGDAVWVYDGKTDRLRRGEGNAIVASFSFIHDQLVRIGRMVHRSRTELEELFARCSPETIVEDAHAVVRSNRKVVRAALLMDDTGRSMVDVIATVTCNVTGASDVDILSIGVDGVRRAQRGLPGCSVTWKDRRLHIVVPGIPEGHPMSAWTAKNNERVDAVRRLLAGVLSD